MYVLFLYSRHFSECSDSVGLQHQQTDQKLQDWANASKISGPYFEGGPGHNVCPVKTSKLRSTGL